MGRLAFILGLIVGLLPEGIVVAAPPGAQLNQKISVPASMRTDAFQSDQYLTVPPGFQISVWARLPGARFLVVAPNGDVFVSQSAQSQITILRPDPSGGSPASFVYATGLNSPQGMAFSTVNGVTWLYLGEASQIDRYVYNTGDTTAPVSRQVLAMNLPYSGSHPLKDVAIGPDQSVYYGFGSSSNIDTGDATSDPVRAAVYKMNPDGSGPQLFASGLRNPEGLAFLPGTNTLWAAVNNRDDIPYPYNDATGNFGKILTSYVDDHPPDLFTSVKQGGDYGWPFCNSNPDSPSGYNSAPFDNDYDTNRDGHVNCGAMDRVTKGIQAHSAPLGLAFLQATSFASPYRNGAVIGYHGSWDRSTPTGYKVAWFPWNSTSQTPGDQIDLVAGFLSFGRPVASAVIGDGSLLITDDATGTIYQLTWAPSAVSAANGYAIVAPNSYAAVYGNGLVAQPTAAQAPYPATLGGASLSLVDSMGQSFAVSLVYVSPTQINFIVPDGVAPGTGHLTLRSGSTSQDLGAPEIRAIAPALFSLSGDGTGIAAATAADANGNPVPISSCTSAGCSEIPIDVSGNGVNLSLYGTGVRGAANGTVQVLVNGNPLRVLFAGAQATYPGLDQINAALPSSLAGAGEVQIEVAIGGVTSNPVTILIK
jgi:uncharacterized protein (TIGR03437 family)